MGYIAPRHAGHICFGGGNACRYAPVSGPMVSIHAKSPGQNVLLEEGGGGLQWAPFRVRPGQTYSKVAPGPLTLAPSGSFTPCHL